MIRAKNKTWNPWLILPDTFRIFIFLVLFHLAIFTVFRIVFYMVFRGAAENPDHPVPLLAWYLGFKYDIRLALLLNLPFLSFSWIKWFNMHRSTVARTIWIILYSVSGLFLFLLYFIDFGHFAYIRSRLNSEILDQMVSIGIALQMVWETYPVIPGLIGIALIVTLYTIAVKKITGYTSEVHQSQPRRSIRITGVTIAVFLVLFGIWGKMSWYPFRWSDAFYSPDEFTAMVALNPVLYLYDTYPHRARAFDLDAVRSHYSLLAEILEVDDPDPEKLAFSRKHIPADSPQPPPNIVLIHLESFSGFKTGIMGNDLNPTPFFDELARKSVLFTHFFVTRPPTARSIYAALFGVPDVYPRRSVSRNPKLTMQRTLINALDGYQKFYFIGGSATWGNIRGLLSHSIPGLRIYEEGDFTDDRIDVWGISDLHLMRKAHQVFLEQTDPFFAFIQTSGNHRPYSIPDDCGSFEIMDIDDDEAIRYGFESGKAVDGMRFMDYCIKECIELASGAPYFDNTIFCMYGDHGSPSTTDSVYERLGLTSNHVPMVIYSPRYFPDGVILDMSASSVDLMPTLVRLAGKPYVNWTMGRDLFAPRDVQNRCAFIDNGRRIGVLNDEFFLQLFPQDRVSLHRYRKNGGDEDVSADYPEITAEMKTLCDALHKCAQYMMYHNKPSAE